MKIKNERMLTFIFIAGIKYVEVSSFRTTNPPCGGDLLRIDYYPIDVCSAGFKYEIVNSTHIAYKNCFSGYVFTIAPVDSSCVCFSYYSLVYYL